MGGLALEDRPEIHDRRRGLVAAIMQVGEQKPDLRVVLRAHGSLERRERVVRAPGVDGGEPQPLQERRIVRRLGQALTKQERGLFRAALAERVPAPALEASHDVLASRRALRVVGRGPSELLARPGKLAGGVQADRLLGERARITGPGGCERDGALEVGRLRAATRRAEEQRRDAGCRHREDRVPGIAGGRHARAQRAGSIRNRD